MLQRVGRIICFNSVYKSNGKSKKGKEMSVDEFTFDIDIECDSDNEVEPFYAKVLATFNYTYSAPMYEDRSHRLVADPGCIMVDMKPIEIFSQGNVITKELKALNPDKFKEIEQEAQEMFDKRLEDL